MLEACEIVYENLEDFLRLEVREDQEDLVADNAVTIAEAHYMPFSWMRGLQADNEAVGLIAMIDLRPEHPEFEARDPENTALLWRLMIAAQHQGKGYGRQAMALAFEQARQWGRDRMGIYVADREGSALAFYRRFGFEQTGRIDEFEHLLLGPVPPNP